MAKKLVALGARIVLVGLIWTGGGFGSASQSFAIPSYTSRWPAITIKAAQASEWLRDSADEQLIWLLPPKNGRIALRNDTPKSHSNHKLCPELKRKLQHYASTSTQFRQLLSYIQDTTPKLTAAQQRYRKGLEDLARWRHQAPVHQDMAALWHKTLSYSEQQRYAEHKLSHCHKTEYCLHYDHDSVIAHTRLTDARISLKGYSKSQPQAFDQLSGLTAAIDKAQAERLELRRKVDSYRQHLIELETMLTRAYRKDALKVGGSIRVDYLPGHKERLKQLSRSNPSYRFKLVPLADMRLYARMVPEVVDDYYLSTLPAFLKFEALDSSDGIAARFAPDANPLPRRLRGRFTLSLHGACALLDKGFFTDRGLKVRRNESSTPSYAAVLQYHYPVAVPEPVTLHYNLAAVYELLEQQRKDRSVALINPADIDLLLARDALRSVIDIRAKGTVSSQLRDTLSKVVIQQLLTHITTPTLTLAGDLSPWALGLTHAKGQLTSTPCRDAACQTGGWLRLQGDALTQAIAALRQLPSQRLTLGPDSPILVVGLSQFVSWRVDGL